MWRRCQIVLLLMCFVAVSAQAQELVPVPDVVGLNVPQAAAALNRVGLALRVQNNVGWTESAGLPANTISAQAVAAGTTAAPGTAVDVMVLRWNNIAMFYDENDFTILNLTGTDLGFGGLIFNALDGAGASFAGTRWGGSILTSRCAQVWSISRGQPKDVEGCERISAWLVTNNPAEHFWTGLNGATRFNVGQNGVERANCPTAPAGSALLRCDMYIPVGGGDEATPYVYFAYTPERFIVFNRSEGQWMPLANTVLYNFNPNLGQQGAPISLGDATLYGSRSPVADVTQLAPGQCVLFTNSQSPEALNLPEPCDVVGQANLDPTLTFWTADFQLHSITDGQRRTCNGATAGRLTLCLMPR